MGEQRRKSSQAGRGSQLGGAHIRDIQRSLQWGLQAVFTGVPVSPEERRHGLFFPGQGGQFNPRKDFQMSCEGGHELSVIVPCKLVWRGHWVAGLGVNQMMSEVLREGQRF